MANPNPSAAREALAAKREQTQYEANVPVISSDEVERIKAQLAQERAEADAAKQKLAEAESKLKQYQGVTYGMPQPQPADPYVPDIDTDTLLNQFNSSEVINGADYAGKPGWKTSRVTHRLANNKTGGKAGTFWFYDEGGFARKIPNQSMSSAFASGLYPVCPLCHDYHPESETNPNVCPARKKVAQTRCPICWKNGIHRPIYDTVELESVPSDGFKDDLAQEVQVPSTPAERLKVILEQHIRAYHHQTAASMKLQDSM